MNSKILIGFAILLFPFLQPFSALLRDQPKPTQECGDRISAFVMAQLFVKDRLKSPASARFPNLAEDNNLVTRTGDCTFRVTSYVDSENGFGADLRTRFTADIEYVPTSDSWSLKNLLTD